MGIFDPPEPPDPIEDDETSGCRGCDGRYEHGDLDANAFCPRDACAAESALTDARAEIHRLRNELAALRYRYEAYES